VSHCASFFFVVLSCPLPWFCRGAPVPPSPRPRFVFVVCPRILVHPTSSCSQRWGRVLGRALLAAERGYLRSCVGNNTMKGERGKRNLPRPKRRCGCLLCPFFIFLVVVPAPVAPRFYAMSSHSRWRLGVQWWWFIIHRRRPTLVIPRHCHSLFPRVPISCSLFFILCPVRIPLSLVVGCCIGCWRCVIFRPESRSSQRWCGHR
jgi:hypothetical protein